MNSYFRKFEIYIKPVDKFLEIIRLVNDWDLVCSIINIRDRLSGGFFSKKDEIQRSNSLHFWILVLDFTDKSVGWFLTHIKSDPNAVTRNFVDMGKF